MRGNFYFHFIWRYQVSVCSLKFQCESLPLYMSSIALNSAREREGLDWGQPSLPHPSPSLERVSECLAQGQVLWEMQGNVWPFPELHEFPSYFLMRECCIWGRMSVFWKYNTASGLEKSLQVWIQWTLTGCLSTPCQALLQMLLISKRRNATLLPTGRGARSPEICLL